MKLFNIDANAKTVKGQKFGYLTAVLYLAPFNLSGYQVCPNADGCEKPCLGWEAGRAAIIEHGAESNPIRDSRVAKTRLYFEHRAAFMALAVKEIMAACRKAAREALELVVRLNGSSDIPWERVPVTVDGTQYPNMMAAFPAIQFYDYTKSRKRALAFANGEMPANYHLTFSLSASNDDVAAEVLAAGVSVAAVFRKGLPAAFMGAPVVDGDESDLRFADERGVVVGLKAKGAAKKDQSGFVREAA